MEVYHRNIKANEKAGVKKGNCLSSGEVQLTLNCLGLELEHLILPRGDEEQRMVPPSVSVFLLLLLLIHLKEKKNVKIHALLLGIASNQPPEQSVISLLHYISNKASKHTEIRRSHP